MPMPVEVTSEIGRLRSVLVHSPGEELLAVTPSNRGEYLYDDIIDLECARTEHQRFVSILSRFAEVREMRQVLIETFSAPEARQFLITRSEEVTADKTLGAALREVSPEVLVERFIQGWRMPTGPFSEKLEKQGYLLPPVPNLFFTRDAAVVIGNQVVIAGMRFTSRWPEEALMRTLFGYHAEIGGTSVLYDGSDERRYGYSLEGGDVHPLRPDLVVVGISERTSVAAVDALSEILFARTEVTDVLAVVLLDRTTAIHLDMVWTQVDRELCVAHPPMFRGPTRAPVLHRKKGRKSIHEPPTLFAGLHDVGYTMDPIYVGGTRWELQEREQWASGCNFFAVAPGQVLAYERNEQTLRTMEKAGFRLVSSDAILNGTETVSPTERVVITFAGSELVRWGGGPRCMTCPLSRDSL